MLLAMSEEEATRKGKQVVDDNDDEVDELIERKIPVLIWVFIFLNCSPSVIIKHIKNMSRVRDIWLRLGELYNR